jgi:hypothetical protein
MLAKCWCKTRNDCICSDKSDQRDHPHIDMKNLNTGSLHPKEILNGCRPVDALAQRLWDINRHTTWWASFKSLSSEDFLNSLWSVSLYCVVMWNRFWNSLEKFMCVVSWIVWLRSESLCGVLRKSFRLDCTGYCGRHVNRAVSITGVRELLPRMCSHTLSVCPRINSFNWCRYCSVDIVFEDTIAIMPVPIEFTRWFCDRSFEKATCLMILLSQTHRFRHCTS